MLVYQNKGLIGYYLLSCEDFDFRVIDNNLICSLIADPKCVNVLDFDPRKPHDWYIHYTEETGDVVSFEKYDPGSSCGYLPCHLMFAD